MIEEPISGCTLGGDGRTYCFDGLRAYYPTPPDSNSEPPADTFYDPISRAIANVFTVAQRGAIARAISEFNPEPVTVYYSEPESHGDSVAFSFSFNLAGHRA